MWAVWCVSYLCAVCVAHRPSTHTGLAGEHQKYNASLALQLCNSWETSCKPRNTDQPGGITGNSNPAATTAAPFELASHMVDGIAESSWPGRNQVLHIHLRGVFKRIFTGPFIDTCIFPHTKSMWLTTPALHRFYRWLAHADLQAWGHYVLAGRGPHRRELHSKCLQSVGEHIFVFLHPASCIKKI